MDLLFLLFVKSNKVERQQTGLLRANPHYFRRQEFTMSTLKQPLLILQPVSVIVPRHPNLKLLLTLAFLVTLHNFQRVPPSQCHTASGLLEVLAPPLLAISQTPLVRHALQKLTNVESRRIIWNTSYPQELPEFCP